ncbi:unnamed protein product [Amoebophrya sp. A25]|nr:unnamed protein product [Amoebophrya sp. A25]|eukprot:GSA25T00010039001.1
MRSLKMNLVRGTGTASTSQSLSPPARRRRIETGAQREALSRSSPSHSSPSPSHNSSRDRFSRLTTSLQGRWRPNSRSRPSNIGGTTSIFTGGTALRGGLRRTSAVVRHSPLRGTARPPAQRDHLLPQQGEDSFGEVLLPPDQTYMSNNQAAEQERASKQAQLRYDREKASAISKAQKYERALQSAFGRLRSPNRDLRHRFVEDFMAARETFAQEEKSERRRKMVEAAKLSSNKSSPLTSAGHLRRAVGHHEVLDRRPSCKSSVEGDADEDYLEIEEDPEDLVDHTLGGVEVRGSTTGNCRSQEDQDERRSASKTSRRSSSTPGGTTPGNSSGASGSTAPARWGWGNLVLV